MIKIERSTTADILLCSQQIHTKSQRAKVKRETHVPAGYTGCHSCQQNIKRVKVVTKDPVRYGILAEAESLSCKDT